MGHLNINSLRNKFELLSSLIGGANQFFIQGYSTVYRLDRNDKGG